MGKQIKTGVYQYNAFGEMDVVKELRAFVDHQRKLMDFYGAYWSAEKKAEVQKKIDEAVLTIDLLS